MFSSLVFNNSALSAIEKLHYLKNSLQGAAAVLLQHTALISDIFQKAWDDIVAYYDNKRILIDSALHELFSFKQVQKESAVDLESLYTTLQQNIRTLETLNQPVQHWDAIIVYLTTRRLDRNSIRAWELDLGSFTVYPTWVQLRNFLISRIRSLQALERTSVSKSNSQTQSRVHLHQKLPQTSKQCPVCNKPHHVWSCPDYTSKPRERKWDIIKRKKLCINCLGSHLVNSCPSPRRCLKCGKKYHTSIHTNDSHATPALSTSAAPSPSKSNQAKA